MNILITGGLGYIGSHIFLELYDSNNNIIIVDNLLNSHINQLNKLEKIINNKIIFYQLDISDYDKLAQVFKKHNINLVIHLAGLKYISESINNPHMYFDRNIRSTLTLLKAMQFFNVRDILFSSTASIYKSSNKPVNEFHSIEPLNPYSMSKYVIENILSSYKTLGLINFIALRYFNPIGCHSSGIISENISKFSNNIMPKLIKTLKYDETFYINGNTYQTDDGSCVRDYIHVVDLAKAHKASLDFLLNQNEINFLNIGTGNPVSVIELVYTFEKLCGKKLDIRIGEKRMNDIVFSLADVSLARENLSWRPVNNLEAMCRDVLKSLENNG